jgi:molybdopterin molybdotransferase
MVSVEEAQDIIRSVEVDTARECVPLSRALHRVLARDAVSGIAMPPFHKSAMDGYALNSRDASSRFRVVGTIPAGAVPDFTLRKGQCAKIMTGGMLPRGADRVVRREVTAEDNGVMRIAGRDDGPNICTRGEDVKPGEVVLAKGAFIRAQEIGILASIGAADVEVFARPSVAIIATGSEIVAPGRPLKKGLIYDSNSHSLAAQAAECRAVVQSRRRAVDKIPAIRRAVESGLKTCRMVLVSGGVSAGDLDYVPETLKAAGVKLRFEQIAVQPGKPTVFGTRDDRIVFGVPGNPVSAFIIFEVFIKPILLRMMGRDARPLEVSGTMVKPFLRKKIERAAFVPVRVLGDRIELLDYHGSAHIHALGRANALLYVPKGAAGYAEGSRVNVRLL